MMILRQLLRWYCCIAFLGWMVPGIHSFAPLPISSNSHQDYQNVGGVTTTAAATAIAIIATSSSSSTLHDGRKAWTRLWLADSVAESPTSTAEANTTTTTTTTSSTTPEGNDIPTLQKLLLQSSMTKKRRREIERELDLRFAAKRLNSISIRDPAVWETNFAVLKEYKKVFGTADIPYVDIVRSSHPDEFFKLARWVKVIRNSIKKNLTAKQVADMDSLGFTWDGELLQNQINNNKWERMYEELLRFRDEYNHTKVTQKYVTKDGKHLGLWVKTQRISRGTLQEDRKEKLDEAGFVWALRPPNIVGITDQQEKMWMKKFEELKEFMKENNHMTVRSKDNYPLQVWISRQRNKEKLREDRKKLLDSIGFIWDIQEQAWDSNFEGLKTIYEKRRNGEQAPFNNTLFKFCEMQRTRHVQQTLEPHRVAKLESIGFDFRAPTTWNKTWERNFEELKAFYEKRSRAEGVVQSEQLRKWATSQRTKNNNNKLTEEQKAKLASINFDFNPRNKRWERKFEEFKAFYEKRSHGERVVQDEQLRTWAISQRVKNNNNELTEEQKAKLASINFDFNPRNERWERKFEEVKALYEKRSRGERVVQGEQLRNWTKSQRVKNKKLTEEQKAKLASINFDFNPRKRGSQA